MEFDTEDQVLFSDLKAFIDKVFLDQNFSRLKLLFERPKTLLSQRFFQTQKMFWAQNLFWSRNFYGPKFWQDLKNSKQHFFHRLKFFGLKIFWSKNFSCNLYLFLVQNFLNKKSFWSANLFWTETKVLPNWSLTLKTKSCVISN